MRNTIIESQNGQMMSKTQHYRKVTKPLLERKRRARMNHYLDELKNLIVETMEAQGEHITKLEKADILEMTVTYLKNKSKNEFTPIKTPTAPVNPEKFRAGYTQAAYEVSKVFASVPGIDVEFGTKLMKHLGYKLKDLKPPPVNQYDSEMQNDDSNSLIVVTPPQSPRLISSPVQFQQLQPSKVDNIHLAPPGFHLVKMEQQSNDVWRPW